MDAPIGNLPPEAIPLVLLARLDENRWLLTLTRRGVSVQLRGDEAALLLQVLEVGRNMDVGATIGGAVHPVNAEGEN